MIKRLAGDFGLNLLASFVSTGILQLLLYPFLAVLLPAEEYGVMLTIMGVGNTIAAALGGSLNNTRLLQEAKYNASKLQGDFSLMNLAACLAAAISIIGYGLFVISMKGTGIFLLALYCVLLTLRNYASVTYRLVIDYRKNFILNLAVGSGILFGIGILKVFQNKSLWMMPFMVGEICGIAYIFFSSAILKEKICVTPLMPETLRKELILFFTTLAANIIQYLDRLLLLPVLGGGMVSVYTVASFLGKSLGVVMTPLAGVLLSYYAKSDFAMTRGRYWKINAATMVFALVFFLISVSAGDWATGLFYPTLIDAARPFILLANLAAVINVMSSMIQPSVLRFAPVKWQLAVQGIYGTMYIALGLLAAEKQGLMGFCYAALGAAIVKLMILLFIGDAGVKGVKDGLK